MDLKRLVVDPKITIAKKNGSLKESQPDESRIIPFNNGGEIYLNINLPA